MLYETPSEFFFLVKGCGDRFDEIAKVFDQEIRPVTCPMRLIQAMTAVLTPVDEAQQYGDELWLQGDPISVPVANQILNLTEADLPIGGIDFSNEDDTWIFLTHAPLAEGAKARVQKAYAKMGFIGEISFRTQEPSGQLPAVSRWKPDGLQLSSSRSLCLHSTAVRRLVEEDETTWRDFLDSRGGQGERPSAEKSDQFSCLFDTADRGDIRLSELLTIYDRIDIIPARDNPNWLVDHRLSVPELLELVSLGRCRVVLPYSAELCRPDLLDGIAELNPSAVVLSRDLAVKTVQTGQHKEPLLYGPFTALQRTAILNALHQVAPNDLFKSIVTCYGEMFRRQHYALMMNGAMASLSCGVGAYLGEVIEKLHGKDARIELASAGAGIEWAMALGSTWIPRSFGEGYDETGNCHLIASFLGRTTAIPVDPIGPRMHLLADGLLAMTDVPPMEIARNFNSGSVREFRGLAMRLMQAAPSHEEMRNAIDQINTETVKFERRASRLAKWKIDTLIVGGLGKPIGDALDAQMGPYASVMSAWLYEHLKRKIPSAYGEHLFGAMQTLLGLALAPSADAVIVSRSRQKLKA